VLFRQSGEDADKKIVHLHQGLVDCKLHGLITFLRLQLDTAILLQQKASVASKFTGLLITLASLRSISANLIPDLLLLHNSLILVLQHSNDQKHPLNPLCREIVCAALAWLLTAAHGSRQVDKLAQSISVSPPIFDSLCALLACDDVLIPPLLQSKLMERLYASAELSLLLHIQGQVQQRLTTPGSVCSFKIA
jgi:hypothetical protein